MNELLLGLADDELIIGWRDSEWTGIAPMLEEEGYQVATAAHGGEALDLLGVDDLPDVILLDLRMPVMDGWTFRDAQRRDSRLASIPVVVSWKT